MLYSRSQLEKLYSNVSEKDDGDRPVYVYPNTLYTYLLTSVQDMLI